MDKSKKNFNNNYIKAFLSLLLTASALFSVNNFSFAAKPEVTFNDKLIQQTNTDTKFNTPQPPLLPEQNKKSTKIKQSTKDSQFSEIEFDVVDFTVETPTNPDKLTDEQTEKLLDEYKNISKDLKILTALNILKNSVGNYSRMAILGYNLSRYRIKVSFKDLTEISQKYKDFDALGWKRKGKLYIFINKKHQDAPPEAIAAILAHEALHQDEFNSINEETYAWTMEAAVWTQLTEKNKDLEMSAHPLVSRENTLKKLYKKGGFTNKYIKKTVTSNPGYSNLPSRSPGFEDSL